jgi:beta-N-acetylhexosaminidase
MTDDLSMQALSGSPGERAHLSFKAGCDVVLHCNGDMAEMRAVAEATGRLKGKAKARAEAAMARIVRVPEPLDPVAGHDRFFQSMGGRLDVAQGPDVGEAQA